MKSADSASSQAAQIKANEQILADIRPSAVDSPKETNVWTPQQQKQLEGALKTIPATDPERWNKIAECVEGKTKKECMRRFKELGEMVKAKNAAKMG